MIPPFRTSSSLNSALTVQLSIQQRVLCLSPDNTSNHNTADELTLSSVYWTFCTGYIVVQTSWCNCHLFPWPVFTSNSIVWWKEQEPNGNLLVVVHQSFVWKVLKPPSFFFDREGTESKRGKVKDEPDWVSARARTEELKNWWGFFLSCVVVFHHSVWRQVWYEGLVITINLHTILFFYGNNLLWIRHFIRQWGCVGCKEILHLKLGTSAYSGKDWMLHINIFKVYTWHTTKTLRKA